MKNSINEKQNTKKNLQYLAAQRLLYSRAKLILVIQIVLTIPFALIWAILISFYPELTVWSVFFSLVVSVLEAAFFDFIQETIKTKAAKIQEMFDSEVLGIKWNNFKIEEKVDIEEVFNLADKYEKKDKEFSTLQNWYPVVVGQLPLVYARLVCQRCNLWWNSTLRTGYSKWLITLIVATVIIVFSIALSGGMTTEKLMLAVLSPLTPSIIWGIKEYQKQKRTAESLNTLKSKINILWNEILEKRLTESQLEEQSRFIQDEIFNHRKNDPLIFDWVYKILKQKQEDQMSRGADDVAGELIRVLGI